MLSLDNVDEIVPYGEMEMYAAEHSVIYKCNIRWFASAEEVMVYCQDIVGTRWWRNRTIAEHIHVYSTRDTIATCQKILYNLADPDLTTPYNKNFYGGVLTFPQNGWNEITVLHELAHLLTNNFVDDQHGAEFRRNFLSLLKRFSDGQFAETLKMFYKGAGYSYYLPRGKYS